MLRHITVRDFAIIEHLEVELGAGMIALTGETGAGKSILIDVVGLLLGDRGESSCVREGAAQADLGAEFDLAPGHPGNAWLQEQALAEAAGETPGPEAESVLLRRVITAQGKSRAWINGRPVTMAQLKTLGAWLVDIHGQHAHQLLLQRPAQRELLDGFVDPVLLRDTADAHDRLRVADQRLQATRERLLQNSDRLDLLRFQSAEIAELAPRDGEYEALAAEQSVLAHATEVLAALQSAHEAIESDNGIDSGMSRLLAGLQEAGRHDRRIGPVLESLESARIQLQDAGDQLRRLADHVESDPERLDEVDTRIAAYLRLARKHRVEPDDLATLLQRMETELAELDAGDAALESLEQGLATARADYAKAADALSVARHKAAKELDQAVTKAMQELGMIGGCFRVDLQKLDGDAGPHGRDRIEFRVAANPGSAPQPLARVASGGELSRIGLALQVLASAAQTVDTLIFDEVDSGISGAVAEVVGRKLRGLGERYQVLCVTHLPQVAAQAHRQLQVSKRQDERAARTEITPLDAEGRVEAIARMLGGVRITERSRAHAREMLETAPAAG
jgi:DNA repair protein RecN (Recombination protein N)